jgi:hypothetical protein
MLGLTVLPAFPLAVLDAVGDSVGDAVAVMFVLLEIN